jgi:hypothetical protein
VTKPKVRVITQPSPEVGFTTFGPILNLRIAITVTHKDIVVTGIKLRATHESGDQSNFSWRGIVQRMGTLNHPENGPVQFEKELNVIAMKVSLKDVEERHTRFQSLVFLERKSELEAISVKRLELFRQSGNLDRNGFLKGYLHPQ